MRITHSLRKRYLGEEWPWVKDEKPFRPYNYILSTFLASFLSTLILVQDVFFSFITFLYFVCVCLAGTDSRSGKVSLLILDFSE